MAFKNLFSANVATGCDFKKTNEGFGTGANTTNSPSKEQSYRNDYSLKLTPRGTGVDGYCNIGGDAGAIRLGMVPGESYTIQSKVYSPNPTPGSPITVYYKQGTAYKVFTSPVISTPSTWTLLSIPFTLPPDATEAFVRLRNQFNDVTKSVYFDDLMFQTGLTADPWEFPGIDLTGNSIPANTLINNVKLENIIRAFGIESTEHVNNLTLENLLTLTGIPSEEYVNNIELLNEIIIEAIENTTSVKDLILYIKCNYLNLKFEMKYPSTSFKMKQPHTDFKMKYP